MADKLRGGSTVGGNLIWHTGNDGSGSGLDADLLDGMNATTAATANTIVARDANGYVYANALNSTLADTANSASHYMVETGSDGWLRPKTLANVKTEIAGDRLALAGGTLTGSLAGTTFTGTSFNSITALSSTAPVVAGTAAVGTSTTVARADHVHPLQTTITGNAGSATFQTSNVTGSSCLAIFHNTPAGSTSTRECSGWADAPNTGWWVINSIRHTNSANYWGTQIAYGWEDNANAIYQRNVSAGTWSAWTRVDVSSANITELVNNAGFATTAAVTTTVNGLMIAADKTKLDGVAAGANAYTLPVANAATFGGIKASVSGTTLTLNF
jgi:hypothetical protein